MHLVGWATKKHDRSIARARVRLRLGLRWGSHASCCWLLAGGCGKSAKRANCDLPIYFTCDTRGRLEPCGCFEGQFGGLTRLKTVLDDDAPENALRVDIGDSIGGHEDYDFLEYRYLLRAFAAMKFDALNIGHREARLTATQLQEIKKTAPVAILSANLIDKASGKPIFDSFKIVERGDFRIAVIGVVDPRGLGDELGAGLAVGDYCLSKAAVSMMTRIFALRLAQAGIMSYEVRPGVIRTDMTKVAAARYDKLIAEGLTPIARWGEPEDVGRAVAVLASGELPFVTGDAVHVDEGMHIARL